MTLYRISEALFFLFEKILIINLNFFNEGMYIKLVKAFNELSVCEQDKAKQKKRIALLNPLADS